MSGRVCESVNSFLNHPDSFNVKTGKTENIPRDFFQRRFKRISATELAVVFPTVFFALWLVRIGIGFP